MPDLPYPYDTRLNVRFEPRTQPESKASIGAQLGQN